MSERKSCYDCKNHSSFSYCSYYHADKSNSAVRDYLLYDDASDCPGFTPINNCFMTSACVDFMGKPDDCEELETLRKFRDEKLTKTKEGEALAKEYYRVAPKIVDAIKASNKKKGYYKDIYETVAKCVELINGGKDEEAILLYRLMFEKYRNLFSL